MNKNYTITNEFIDYTQGVVRWTVELPADSSDRTSIENNAHRDALNHPSTVQVPAHKPPPIPVASSPTTKSYAEPSGMDADDPIVVTAMDEYLLIPAARPTSLFNIDSSIPSEQTEDRDEPDVNASPAEGARPPSPFLPLLPGGADCRDPVRPPSSGAEPLVGPSYISDTARPSSPPRTSEALLATQWHDLSYFLKRPPQRQFVSGALSIDPPLCPGKGKQRADVGPDVNARCIQHAPSASADDTTPVIRRPRDEDDSSSEEEPLSRKPRSRPAAVNPPVILPGIHYDISKRSSSPAADDEIISIADSSDAEESSLHHALLCPQDGIIRIESHQQRDKPRRLLMRGDPGGTIGASGLYTVSMHGVVNHVYADPLRFSHTLLKMDDKTDTQMIDRHNSIDDACVLSDGTDEHFVFGHKNGSPELCVARVRDQKLVEYRSLQQVRSRKGVSAVCALPQPLTFATGGYDHSIHLWQLDRTLSCSPRILSVIRHASTVQALLPLHDKSSKLITAGADSVVNVYDLPSERVINTFKASVSVYHLHPTSFASCALLEVGHLEQQWEIRDLRKVPDRPVVRFGYTAGETHGRYMKGSAHAHLFAGGDTKGNVRLWDVRKTTKPLSVVEGLPGQKVSQVTFRNSSQLVVCSEANYLRVLDLQ
ncbi:WD40-repeat-containing domain protein [Schizophyllum amplum]|uniref:WD40-repeat-containing domain protein n=1 Tax=Schizophyllum amplum TaxID=97359 RepID=A0A550CU08_9AGAR|nr:WD40-repeat-containing domain protein [Auriculariopsis ampla]